MQEKASVIDRQGLTSAVLVDDKIIQLIREHKSALVLRGITQATIARNIGVSRSALHRVMNGKARSRYIEQALLRYGIDLAPLRALILLREVL